MTSFTFACTDCEDTGWRPVTDPTGRTRYTPCRRCEYWPRLRGPVPGLPARWQAVRLADFEPRQGVAVAREVATRWVRQPSDLYLWGPVGTGKSMLAAALLNEAWRQGRTAYWVSIPVLLEEQRIFYDDPERRGGLERETWGQFKAADVVVLDDVGGESGSDFARRLMTTFYQLRLDQANHWTLWTSNLSLDDLGKLYGDDRLISRLAGYAQVVKFEGTDFRLPQRQAKEPHHGEDPGSAR